MQRGIQFAWGAHRLIDWATLGQSMGDGGIHAKGARSIGADISLYEVSPVSMGRAEGKAEGTVKQTLVNREPCSVGDATAWLT